MRHREHLHKDLESKAESAIGGENEAQRKLSDVEADLEIRRWERRISDVALNETFRELESQRLQLHQANT